MYVYITLPNVMVCCASCVTTDILVERHWIRQLPGVVPIHHQSCGNGKYTICGCEYGYVEMMHVHACMYVCEYVSRPLTC